MITGLVFQRSKAGHRGSATSNSDALFSRVSEAKHRDSLSVRVHQDVMRRLRWMIGDYVILKAEDDGQKWIMERVSGPKQGGMKLSRSGDKSTASGTVRFCVPKEILDEIFKDKDRSFTATLCDSGGNQAVFLVD